MTLSVWKLLSQASLHGICSLLSPLSTLFTPNQKHLFFGFFCTWTKLWGMSNWPHFNILFSQEWVMSSYMIHTTHSKQSAPKIWIVSKNLSPPFFSIVYTYLSSRMTYILFKRVLYSMWDNHQYLDRWDSRLTIWCQKSFALLFVLCIYAKFIVLYM